MIGPAVQGLVLVTSFGMTLWWLDELRRAPRTLGERVFLRFMILWSMLQAAVAMLRLAVLS